MTVVSSHPSPAGDTLTKNVQQTTLSNGLTVLTKEVHTAPVVSVQVWYRVGARNEKPGSSGIAHQLEHLLFKGTHQRPIQFGRLFSALGSDSNAFTSYDMTAYFGTVSRDKLEALLVLEADRMRNARIDAEQLASEQRVVISELQGYENSPEYRLGKAVMQRAFPNHPYGLSVGGSKADVEKFTAPQVKDYYDRFYCPSNAVLVITGDFETASTLAVVEQAFGDFAASPVEPVITASLDAQGEGTPDPIILREPGSTSLLEAVYPLPNVHHPDVPALDIMDSILSAGRNSRFYQALIDSGLASYVSAYAVALMEPGWYNISVVAAPDQDLETLDRVLQETITVIQQQPVSAEELLRAKVQLKASLILSNREIDHQASQLAYNQIVSGDYRYSDRYLAHLEAVTAADVQRVAAQYLKSSQRTSGWFEPSQLTDQPFSGGPATQTAEDFSPSEPVDPAVVAQYLPPIPDATVSSTQALPEKVVLSNGLRVLLLEDHSSPTVTLSGYIQAGNSFDLQSPGLAGLTADNLLSGTQTKDALTLAKALENCGAGLDFSSFREGVDIEGYALSSNISVLLDTLADVLQNATFPEQEVLRSQQRTLSGLKMELDDPGRLARRTFQQRIYPATHPFHSFPTEESLRAITRDDLQHFYQTHYLPRQTILTLVGDFKVGEITDKLEHLLGAWQSQGSVPSLSFPEVTQPSEIDRLQVPMTGKSQVVTYLGYCGINRHDPRYYAALLFNQVLGGDTLASRLGTEIRDRQGLTYGIYSYFAAGEQAGPFAIQMQTSPEDSEQAISSTLMLLRQLRESGITASELETVQRTLVNSYPVDLAAPDLLAQRILMNEVHGLPLTAIQEFPQKLNDISLDEVNAAIESLIHPDKLIIVTAGAQS
ncbi:putative zinc protease [Acaryochloris thomasi RCC1774]|uniref:Putative zinc protease n=1 Tax=Acaryochloris thomasi RCC1774 TaxID=1764569 RepID=A0A2W1JKE7_9CYAN|nr:pitrilysin family protein [Acaryochloris thomasi]PZD73696.1 putative zinc protease [Acaryochloris thomasi RCC1774]